MTGFEFYNSLIYNRKTSIKKQTLSTPFKRIENQREEKYLTGFDRVERKKTIN